MKQQSVSQLQYQSWPSRAVVQQVYFETGPLQCLRDVPQHLNVLSTLITIDLMQIDGHERTVFDVSAFCEAFLRTYDSQKRVPLVENPDFPFYMYMRTCRIVWELHVHVEQSGSYMYNIHTYSWKYWWGIKLGRLALCEHTTKLNPADYYSNIPLLFKLGCGGKVSHQCTWLLTWQCFTVSRKSPQHSPPMLFFNRTKSISMYM